MFQNPIILYNKLTILNSDIHMVGERKRQTDRQTQKDRDRDMNARAVPVI